MRFIPILVLTAFIPLLVYGQFLTTTTNKIDQIENNSGTNIILNPASRVGITYFSGEKALQSSASGELEESAVSRRKPHKS